MGLATIDPHSHKGQTRLYIAYLASVPVRSVRNSGRAFYFFAFGTREKLGASKRVEVLSQFSRCPNDSFARRLHSLRTRTLATQARLYKISKVGANRPNHDIKQDTAIWKCQNLPRNVRPSGHRPNTASGFWLFKMVISQSKLAWLTPNLEILWISVCSFWL